MKLRFITLFLLGFSSGLPFCLIGSTLQAWFSVDSMSIIVVGMLGLVGQPYMYKFLWASWMDRFSIAGLERRRGWIFLLQIGLIALLFVLSFLTPEKHPLIMSGLALLIAFFSASQDTVIDAYRAELLPENERGLGAAVAVAGYRIAVLLSGGLALIMAQYWGWQLTYQCMAGLMFVGLIGNYFAPLIKGSPSGRQLFSIFCRGDSCGRPAAGRHKTGSYSVHSIGDESTEKTTLWSALKVMFQQNKSWQFILLVFLYKLGEAFTSTGSSLSIPFLIQGLGFDLATVGVVNKMGGIAAAIAGSMIAGIVMLRLSLFRALMLFGVGQSFSVLMFLCLAFMGKNLPMLITAVIVDNMAAGMSATALLALMMGMCTRRFTATHFAFLSAVAAFPRVIAGPVGGFLQSYIGWKALYVGIFFATWPGLFLLFYLFSPVRRIGDQQVLSTWPFNNIN